MSKLLLSWDCVWHKLKKKKLAKGILFLSWWPSIFLLLQKVLKWVILLRKKSLLSLCTHFHFLIHVIFTCSLKKKSYWLCIDIIYLLFFYSLFSNLSLCWCADRLSFAWRELAGKLANIFLHFYIRMQENKPNQLKTNILMLLWLK